ncbi:efflux RND transporter permease subunit [Zunongwangia pacifica]|uniref:CusA/CzcA family heavy metal efflux RND transporter n=1 Tax=Zunongwangia pacifica TaxID=2911062 RepID=A0A9X2CQV4_9FLAO|nr:CusA/CzcA family heavy metal efflux RND transporter [Zunongwangia pacifica]MCL6220352.1 CusA/CzcA family heavy metal efflux RND transporter [Zunongwangia pacifica]
MEKFTNALVSFSLKNTLIVFFLTGLLAVIGIYSYIHTPIEAFPDVTNTRARIITQWPGRSAEEVEKFVTLPIMKKMNTIPRKSDVRSISLFGLSVVTIIFEDDVEDFYAQQYAANRLQGVDLPEGTDAEIDPPYGATGEIFRYVIDSERPIKELSAIQEWVIERELLAVPGISDVQSFGGEEKTYQIQVNPTALEQYDLTPLDIYEAITKSNINVGGDMIQKGQQAYVVRGVGLLTSIEDIENTLITTHHQTPVLVKNVAKVELTAKPRLGQVSLDDEDDLVEGIVVMLRGENPAEVIERLKDKITELNERILPKDVQIKPFIDRTELVNSTVKTVSKNLVEGIVLVSLIVLVFLFNWRTTVTVALIIPLSFLFSITLLRIQGMPANLISMGALDFGLLLEGTLVIVEAVYVKLEEKSAQLGIERYNKISKTDLIRKNVSKVAPHIFFAQLILIIALSPIFSFQKVEGKMFTPLAYTLGYALMGSLLLSLTFVPAMCKVLLKKHISPKNNPVVNFFRGNIFRLFSFTTKHRRLTLAVFAAIFALCIFKIMNYGTEFIPQLNEGAVYIRATLPNSVSLEESVKTGKKIKAKLRQFEEVKFVLNQTGRPNDGTDPTGFFNNEFHIQLKPQDEWNRDLDKDELIAEMKDSLSEFKGITFGFSQPIQDNVEEFVAGVKSSLVIKIFGDNLFQMEEQANKVAKTISKIEGITDVLVYKNIGLPELRISLQENKMAQYAVSTEDAQAVIEMAIGGKTASYFYEDERKFDLQIRFEKAYRDSEEEIGNILIPTLDGKKVPLKDIANIEFKTGPAFIYREGSSRYTGIGFSIDGRDLGSTIADAQKAVDEEINFPENTKVEWAGEFESKERATKQLSYIVPAVLLLIVFLLYMNFGNIKDTIICISTLSFAFIGGFISLWLTGTIFGISAGIGFIILFGVCTIDGIILVAVMKENLEHMPLKKAISEGVYSRIRPVIMIALMGSLGLLPAALSNGMGSEVQKPLAIMIVGGLLICMLLSFTVLPQIFYLFYRRKGEKK